MHPLQTGDRVMDPHSHEVMVVQEYDDEPLFGEVAVWIISEDTGDRHLRKASELISLEDIP
jgi:hypothetical protein